MIFMIPMIPILIIVIMIGMIILGLIRPPLTVILPLLGIYIILMLIPYILPNLVINQYLSIKYIILPIIGLAMGYGISILMSKYMNIDVRSLFGLRQDQRRKVKKVRTRGKQKVEKRPEVKPEDLDRFINESINTLKLGISINEALGSWVEYYDGWTDAIISISRRFIDIRESVEAINKEALFLSRIRQYENKALSLGLTLREESAFKKQRRSRSKSDEDRLVIYVRPEELAGELMTTAQLMSGYVDEFNGILEKLIHDKGISQYMVNSQILVLYVDGIPRKFITINKGS
ncbi:hypothetical protein [Vulcanisaeta distributa]|uniref:Uncharacterized protein n=1 Tax=Vulcanisaeta distributa (strain DSM 14429 / JCM 11212 / NBRC 100878 / IC-017) TaxID=572478 RepID=E1QPQ2_VULDI|nr:hypothetical protein [Vulcanisaeta distributa]ADN50348.1 hypothetical protein Vdis_0958 [Vulcanisaeta distributa DSM 14429]